MKPVKIEGENFHIFQMTWKTSMKFWWISWLTTILKITKDHLLSRKYIFGKTTKESQNDPAPSLFRVILLYIIFIYFCDEIWDFSYRILTNQKRKLMVSNCQTTCTLQENLEMLRLVLRWTPKSQILTILEKSCKKSAVKNSIEKSAFLSFANLSTIFFPRFSKETDLYL